MYQEQARRHGQDISTTTDDATFAGGLRHITSVMPSLMNDILQHAPDSQKVCVFKTPCEEDIRRNAYESFITYRANFLRVLPVPLFLFTFCGRHTEREL